jgi:hypothetical protein
MKIGGIEKVEPGALEGPLITYDPAKVKPEHGRRQARARLALLQAQGYGR